MIETEIIEQLTDWMINFVEQPNLKLGGFPPCPYTRQVRINNGISIVFSNPEDFDSAIDNALLLLENKEVVIIAFDHTLISVEDLASIVKQKNSLLMNSDYVILRDHPDDPEYINDVKMNFDRCGLLILQKLSALKKASLDLQTIGYYAEWDSESYHSMTDWR
jgi:hypothetical protein